MTMSRKRHNTSSAEPESPQPKSQDSSSYGGSSEDEDYHEQPQVDLAFGQAGAFPGLASKEQDPLFYGPAQDGIDYLRMVRNEANTIPYLLASTTMTQPTLNTNIDDEYYEGFFDEDEAFVAKPLQQQDLQTLYSRAQQSYYDAILLRFCALRARLRLVPTLQTIQMLPETLPISFPQSSKAARAAWYKHIRQHPPHPVQIAIMDLDSVLELLRMITSRMTVLFRETEEISIRYLGAWIWATLARFPDRGELGSEEIADLRACVRAAESALNSSYGQTSKTGGTPASEYADDSDTNDKTNIAGVAVAEDDSVKAEPMARMVPQAHKDHDMSGAKDQNIQCMSRIRTMLDVVVTVVGEVYGQRDLLELRRSWD